MTGTFIANPEKDLIVRAGGARPVILVFGFDSWVHVNVAGKSTIKAVPVSPLAIFGIFAGCGMTSYVRSFSKMINQKVV